MPGLVRARSIISDTRKCRVSRRARSGVSVDGGRSAGGGTESRLANSGSASSTLSDVVRRYASMATHRAMSSSCRPSPKMRCRSWSATGYSGLCVWNGEHCSSISQAALSPRISSMMTRASRDLPMPASPPMPTTWPCPETTFCQRSRSNLHSASRPTRGVSGATRAAWNRLSTCRSPMTRHARTGWAMPFSAYSPRSSKSNWPLAKRCVARRDDHRIGCCEALQARGEIGRVADDVPLGSPSQADDIADDHQSGGDPHAHAQLQTRHRLQRRHGIHDLQSGKDGPLRRIFVGARVAEIREDAVSHVAGDESVELGDHARRGFLVQPHDLLRVLRIEPLGQRGRVRQVAEHDGQLPALRRVVARRDGSRGGPGDQGPAALAAELRAGSVGVSAIRAEQGEAGAAFAAEALSVTAFGLALRTLHGAEGLGWQAWNGWCGDGPAEGLREVRGMISVVHDKQNATVRDRARERHAADGRIRRSTISSPRTRRRIGREHGGTAGRAGPCRPLCPRHGRRTRPGAGRAGTPQRRAAGPAHPRAARCGRSRARAFLSRVHRGTGRRGRPDLRLRRRCALVPPRRMEGPAARGRAAAGAKPAVSRVARQAAARGTPQRRLRRGRCDRTADRRSTGAACAECGYAAATDRRSKKTWPPTWWSRPRAAAAMCRSGSTPWATQGRRRSPS